VTSHHHDGEADTENMMKCVLPVRKSLQQLCGTRRRDPASASWLFERRSSSLSDDAVTTKLSDSADFGKIYNPPLHPIEDVKLAESVRSCIRGHNKQDAASYAKDTGMSLCFLGTSAGHPTRHRSTSATLLRIGGQGLLFDAGEGVQRQLAFTRAKQYHIERVFITHLHGDHIFGLPGFLLALNYSLREEGIIGTRQHGKQPPKEHVVKIYGPPGIYNYIAASITLSCTAFQCVKIEVYELVGGSVKRVHGGHGLPNPFEAHYPELSQASLRRKVVPCKNGVWTIDDFPVLSRHDILSKTNRNPNNGLRIRAAEVDHLPGVVTFGFVVEEEEPPRNIDIVKAEELGVPPGKKLELLKHGYSVQTEDGSNEVRPEELWLPKKRQSRKIVIVGDNRGWTRELETIASNADVLVHEATLLEENHTVSETDTQLGLFSLPSAHIGYVAAGAFDWLYGWSCV
jgi:ribonuclease Z